MPLTTPRRVVRVLALGALLPSISLAQQGLTPEQVVELQQVGSVALSPDGRAVAYTISRPRSQEEAPGSAYSELWVVPLAGGTPRMIVQRPQNASAPAWSPDGTLLGFVSRIEGQDRNAQVYAVPAGGGEIRKLTSSTLPVLDFAWSPNGRTIAFTAREGEAPGVMERREHGYDMHVAGEGMRHVRLWLQAVDGGQPRAISPAIMTVRTYVWAPDSRVLAAQLTEGTDADSDLMFRKIFAVTADGSHRLLVRTEGKLGPMAFSPDGRQLAFVGATRFNDPLAQSLMVAPVSTQASIATNRTPNYEGSVTWVGWADSNTLTYIAVEGTHTFAYRLNTTRGTRQRIIGGGPEVFQTMSLDRTGRIIAVPANTARHPNEVYVSDGRSAALRRVTRHNAFLDNVAFGRQETIEWRAPDGLRIEGVLIHPVGERSGTRYPLAILAHGGPEGISLDGWSTNALYPAQVMAARGYVVLMPNYRGSGGRGVAFSQADHRDLGGEEFNDVLAGIDHLATRGLIDPQRVGSSGASYGGYFSAWAATRHTDRFKAAISFAGIANWISFTGTTDIPIEMSAVHWDLNWWDSPGLVWDRSPLAHINTAKTPLLLVHGMVDERVHPEQSIQMHQHFKLKGIPTGLVLYPREPHGLRERAHQLDFMARMIEWFDRYLKEQQVSKAPAFPNSMKTVVRSPKAGM